MGSLRPGGLTRSGGLTRPFGGLRHAPTGLGTLRSHTLAARHSGHVDAASSHSRVADLAGARTNHKADNKIVPGHAGISVGDGNGGFKPYRPGPKDPPTVAAKPQIPAGPSGISVDKGNGWEPYQPKKDPPTVAHTPLDGRDAGGDMKIRAGTDELPSWAKVYRPDDGQTIKRTWNGDGTYIDTAVVSYGETSDGQLVRIDDLPRIKAKVQKDCHLLAAKVAQLQQQLAQQQAILSALQGAQNVTVSSTITGVSTSFASEEQQAEVIARLQARIATTQQLLAQYQADLNRCLAGN